MNHMQLQVVIEKQHHYGYHRHAADTLMPLNLPLNQNSRQQHEVGVTTHH